MEIDMPYALAMQKYEPNGDRSIIYVFCLFRFWSSSIPKYSSNMCGRQTQYLSPSLLPDFLPNNACQSTSNWLTILPNQHTRIVIKPHHAPILSLQLFLCPDYYG